ncbi:TetR/AcrR family transcriptional regulator [Rhodococcus sp. NPDC060176]|uniref:TetR/AcrR family transcriptional regulator n=1 Tax=Rhodococcus sp. NPDC060176 TaxID=3347062 RepID=UPI003661A82B
MPQDAIQVSRGTGGGSRPLRADAQHNRDRAVHVARAVFCELGVDASMAEVARRAGVGLSTLFRRFPTKEDLLLAVFSDHIAACSSAIDEALSDPDPRHAIDILIRDVCEKQASDRALASVLISALVGDLSLDVRAHVEYGFAELISRAKANGTLRQDFEYHDVILVLMANAGVVAMSDSDAPSNSSRTVELMLTSFDPN